MKEVTKQYAIRNKTTGKFAYYAPVCNYLKMVPFAKATIWKRKATAEMWLKINTNRNKNPTQYRIDNQYELPVPYELDDLVVVEIKVTREVHDA